MKNRKTTVICDIDGTLLNHLGVGSTQHKQNLQLLPGVKEFLENIDSKGYNLILITGRRESARKETEEQLARCGITFDQLVMGVGGGPRVLINDLKPDSGEPTAIAFNLKRNGGFPQELIDL